MKNKKIAVLAVAAVLSMGSLTAAAHGTDKVYQNNGYERLNYNQLQAFELWCALGDNFLSSTRSGNSYDNFYELAGQEVHKADYDAFMASKFAVQPASHSHK